MSTVEVAVRFAVAGSGIDPQGVIFPRCEEEFCNDRFLEDVLQNRFTFNGESHDLGPAIDWLRNPARDLEWQILLHKFYYAPGLARRYLTCREPCYLEKLIELITDWMRTVPDEFIAADVTGRRVQNWIYAWYMLRELPGGLPAQFEDDLQASIERQVDVIVEHIAPARNHRTLELYTIILAAIALPHLAAAPDWLAFAVREMLRNIESDLLPDGVHCELSTDYHHIVLRNYLQFLRLARANGISVPSSVQQRLELALEFSLYVHRPDGRIPALSDGDSRSHLDVLESGAQLFGRPDFLFGATGGRLGTAPRTSHALFSRSGYCVLRSPWGAAAAFGDARYLVFDCGPVGAGNHGHMDALNIEVAACGRPLIVDPGRYTYDESGAINWRAHFRSTLAHNTISVDGLDQCVYRQHGERRRIVLPHPRTELVTARLNGRFPYLCGRTASPNYDAVHERHILFVDDDFWLIIDCLGARRNHDYALNFQFDQTAQGAVWVHDRAGAIETRVPGLQMLTTGVIGEAEVIPGQVSSRYGRRSPAPRLLLRRRAASTSWLTVLLPHRLMPRAIHCLQRGSEFWVQIDGVGGRWRWDPVSRQLRFRDQQWTFPSPGPSS